MMVAFRWNDWNVAHIGGHGIEPEEAEEIVRAAARPYPKKAGSGKYLVRGRTWAGRYLQVVYIIDPPEWIYVIHARSLTEKEIRQYRRRLR